MLISLILALLFFQGPAPNSEQIAAEKKVAMEKAAAVLRKIQPHPSDPTNLQALLFDMTFLEQHKSLWGSAQKPLSGKVRIEQKRAKDGYFECATRYLDVNGRLYSQVLIDPTLRNPSVVLFIVLDDNGREVRHVEFEISKEEFSGPIVRKVVF